MPDVNDMALVRDYADRNSESAFAELVHRHINLVYSVALRFTGHSQDAQDVTQAVFIILAQKAASLRERTILTGWLYETTRFTATKLLRTTARQQAREQEAYMQSTLNDSNPDNVWQQLAPLLENAMTRLNEKERTLLALRFFENKSGAETAAILGIQEWAAHKRANRALEKLRKFFTKRGVSSTPAIIAGAISANSVQAAPLGLAKSVTAVAVAKGAAAGASILILVKGALKAITWAKVKLTIGVSVSIVAAGGLAVVIADSTNGPPTNPAVALLKKVAAARERIKSGEMEFIVARHDYKWDIQTNYSLLKVVFDGENRRFEQLQRESVATSMAPDAGKIIDAKRIELNGDDNALVKMGLIKFFDAHYRTIYDGKVITQFFPSIDQTKICDPKWGIGQCLFDPRTLGFPTWYGLEDTVESGLTYQNAKSVLLIGKETVEGTVCWHIQTQRPIIVDTVRNLSDVWKFDYWIDVAHPQRVIKVEDPNRGGIFISRYDGQNPSDPLPVEVDATEHFGGDPRPWETRMVRINTRYNVPIEPEAFTLDGLGMPIGTDVVDYRISRRIGYWNGKNLSEQFPRNASRRPDNVINTLENNVQSLENAGTDGSFIDKRKIVLRRVEIGAGLSILIFFVVLMIKRLATKFH